MFLYTYVFNSYYEVRVVQFVSNLDPEICKKTYLNNFYTLKSVFALDENMNYELHDEIEIVEVFASDMSESI